ncbi:MAG TPA: PhoPQ-activated pathogenicity [Candidatus Hydrogenedentes bacterium]|nr:PhoPQ-activated pathogenicity [Candidatus Hydrogenedentota bacterium]
MLFAYAVVMGLLLIGNSGFAAEETALDRYVAKPDDSYKWELVRTISDDGYTGFVLDLTSQTWRNETEIDRPVWHHWLTIVKPDNVDYNTALLYIDGGKNGGEPPAEVSQRFVDLAIGTNTVIAQVRMVPNQPLFFADSKRHGRSEDDLIAHSRVKYIVTKDEEWLARLPMVKSAVRAMDAVQEFMKSEAGGEIPIEGYVVSGGSKRAWTAWLTPIVDERVVAIIPLVIDALNIEDITRHHYNAYGFFSTALGDYVRHGLYPGRLGTPDFARILDIEDPYNYRHRDSLKLPKYLINASGDQFFLPDNSQYYFSEMPGEKYLRYVPNTRHNLGDSDARQTMLAFYESILRGLELPEFSWKIRDDGSISVKVNQVPKEVNLWQATNPEARDFRLDTIGPAYVSSPLTADDNGAYVARINKPEQGFTAFFVELVYDLGLQYPLKFTTDVKVIPDIEPYNLDEAEEIVLR